MDCSHLIGQAVGLALGADLAGIVADGDDSGGAGAFKKALKQFLTQSPAGVIERGRFVGLTGQRPEELETSFKALMGGPATKCEALTKALQAFTYFHRVFPDIAPPLPVLLVLVGHVRPYKTWSPPPPPPPRHYGGDIADTTSPPAPDLQFANQVYVACHVVNALSMDGLYRLHPQLSSQEADLLQSPTTLGYALQQKDIRMVGEICLALRTLGLDHMTPLWDEAQSLLRHTLVEEVVVPPTPLASGSAAMMTPSTTTTSLPASPHDGARMRFRAISSALRGLCPLRSKGYGPVYNDITERVRRLNAKYETISSDGKVALKPPKASAIWCGGAGVASLGMFHWLQEQYSSTAPAHLDPPPPPLPRKEDGPAGGGASTTSTTANISVSQMTIDGLGLNAILDSSLRGRSNRRLNDLLRWKRKRQEEGADSVDGSLSLMKEPSSGDVGHALDNTYVQS